MRRGFQVPRCKGVEIFGFGSHSPVLTSSRISKQLRNSSSEKEMNSTNGFSRGKSTNAHKIFSFGSSVVEI